MKKLLSVPPNVVDCFHELTGLSREEYFCTCDPIGHRLGSGGGTTWLLRQAADWLGGERCIILHAGGQSKRLPSYAVSGKILAPIRSAARIYTSTLTIMVRNRFGAASIIRS